MLPPALKIRPVRLSPRTVLVLVVLLACSLLLTARVFPIHPPSVVVSYSTLPAQPTQNLSHPASLSRSPDPVQLVNGSAASDASDLVRARLLEDMPPCARNGTPTSSFLIVFMGHSGSTALITSIAQHSATNITSFEPVDHGHYVTGSKYEAALRALQYTEALFANGSAMNMMVGFKIRPRHLQLRPSEFSSVIRKYKTRVIWNYRTNIIKQAIGDYAIHYKGDHAAYEGVKVDADGNPVKQSSASRARTFKIHDMQVFHQLLKNRVIGDESVSRALHQISPDGCILPVSYESYLQYPTLTMERIQAFLGLSTSEMHPALRQKATDDTICKVVENWAELCEAFFGCVQWRWMLDDFENGCACSSLYPSKFKSNMNFCSLT